MLLCYSTSGVGNTASNKLHVRSGWLYMCPAGVVTQVTTLTAGVPILLLSP